MGLVCARVPAVGATYVKQMQQTTVPTVLYFYFSMSVLLHESISDQMKKHSFLPQDTWVGRDKSTTVP